MKEYVVQYQKVRYVTYVVKANNEEEAQTVAFNLRERNLNYDYEKDDIKSDEIVNFYKCFER